MTREKRQGDAGASPSGVNLRSGPTKRARVRNLRGRGPRRSARTDGRSWRGVYLRAGVRGPGRGPGPTLAPLKLSIYRRSHYICACVREPLEQTSAQRPAAAARARRGGRRRARPMPDQYKYSTTLTYYNNPHSGRKTRRGARSAPYNKHPSKITICHKILVRTSLANPVECRTESE